MAFTDLTETAAEADYSLSSMVTVELQAQLEQCYQQSPRDQATVGGDKWQKTIQTASTWEGFITSWAAGEAAYVMPVPLRAKREGGWRDITIDLEIQAQVAALVRIYLVPFGSWDAIAAGADPLPGIASYDEFETTSATWEAATFEITPDLCDVRTGDGSVGGLLLPVAWLRFLFYCTSDAAWIDIRSLRIRESI